MDLIAIQDFARGTHIRKATKFLMTSDFWSREQLDAFRLQKLQRLLSYSYENIPYYRRLFTSNHFNPKDIQTLSDITTIPILTKDMVRQYFEDFKSPHINYESKHVKKAKTGGTTGIPLVFYKDTQTRDYTWGSFRRWLSWMGIDKSKDRVAILWGASGVLNGSTSLAERLTHRLENELHISTFNLSDSTIPDVARQLIDFKPVFLRGYLSAVHQLARYCNAEGVRIPSLKAISTTTMTLLPMYRDFIEKTFGVPIFDQYGCGECGGIAYECPAHNGLHITEEHCIIETVDIKDTPVKDQVGRVLVTDLDNYAFPFIRYEIGDSAILSSQECSCGRHTTVIRELAGRTKDTIFLKDGREVQGAFFMDIFYELGYYNFTYFKRFQIYQEKKGDVEIRLERTNLSIPDEKLIQLKETFGVYFNNLEMKVVGQLQNDSSGKFRYLISNLKRNE